MPGSHSFELGLNLSGVLLKSPKARQENPQQVCENDPGSVPMLGIEAVLINQTKLNASPP